jgi:hypothetical protein
VELEARIGRFMDKVRQVGGNDTLVFDTTDNIVLLDPRPCA